MENEFIPIHPAYPPPVRLLGSELDWNAPCPKYNPVYYVHPDVVRLAGIGTQPENPTEEEKKKIRREFKSYHTPKAGWFWGQDGIIRNPMGRTGINGRGLLGQYGPNFVSEPIMFRRNPETKVFEFIAIFHKETAKWMIPGGNVRFDIQVSDVLMKEFYDELMAHANEKKENGDRMREQMSHLFKNPVGTIFRDMVNDSRNTDVAWIELLCTVFLFEDYDFAKSLKFKFKTPLQRICWVSLGTGKDDDFKQLFKVFPPHKERVKQAMKLILDK